MRNAFSLRLFLPLAVALAYWVSAVLALTLSRAVDGASAVWPASGVLLAGLIALPRGYRVRVVGFTAVGSVLANLTAGSGMAVSLGYTAANMIEGVLVAALVRRWCARR